MRIVDVPNDENFIRKVAECLLDGFTTFGIQPWEDLDDAIEEVEDSLEEDKISRAAIDETGKKLVMGSTTGNLWISENGGEAWKQVSSTLPQVYAVRWA